MTVAVATERDAMAKVQKSLLINEDLLRLLEAHQKRTGASFTKQITAAVIQYLFAEPSGPREEWMELAVNLDSEAITVGRIPIRIWEKHESIATSMLALLQGHQNTSPVSVAMLEDTQRRRDEWFAMVKPEDEPVGVERIARFWAEHGDDFADKLSDLRHRIDQASK